MESGVLNPTQRAHAAAMIAEVQRYGLPERAAVIVIETALVESDILVFANYNVPESMNLPHDAVGSDHYSVGPLQQQVPMWGTAHDCMDPAISTRKFLDRLVQFNWQSMPTGEAAQRVQVSAYPDRYQARESQAIQIVNALWEIDMTPAQANELHNLYVALFEGGPSTPHKLPLVTILGALFDAMFHGGTSMPEGKSLPVLVEELKTAKVGP